MKRTSAKAVPERAAVLTKATLEAANLLGLKDTELASVIGVSAPTVSRYRSGTSELDPEHKAGELALLLIRLFRSLDPLVGSDSAKRKVWIHTRNAALGSVPATLIRNPEGLVRTLAYVDGMRAPA
ncbi:MAG: antitoxin Xre-like helix-turn-helix domain-containing protein [Rhodanobacteraceae bacterium]